MTHVRKNGIFMKKVLFDSSIFHKLINYNLSIVATKCFLTNADKKLKENLLLLEL